MPKRGHGEGTIYKRPDGLWTAQIIVGYDLKTGKPKRKSFYGKTRQEVANKLAEVIQELNTGTFIEPSKITFGEWLDKWLVEYKKSQIKPTTYESYEVIINTHIKPALGNIPLAKLQPHMLQAFYNDRLESGLSTRRVHYCHTIIHQALKQSVKEGLLPRNVAEATSPPAIKNKQMRPLSEDELMKFLDVAKDDRLYAAYVVAATTGLRRGELLGLCWDCVDLEQGIIVVKRQLVPLKKKGLILEETTKTKSGKRTVVLPEDTIRELKTHRKRQAQEKLLLGEAYQDHNLVFCTEKGTPLDPRNFTRHFKRLLKKAGLPTDIRLHDLRHTYATLLLKRGVPAKIVQELLGHSSITITLDLYSHVTLEMQKLAVESLNGLLSKEKDLAHKQGNK